MSSVAKNIILLLIVVGITSFIGSNDEQTEERRISKSINNCLVVKGLFICPDYMD